MNDISIFSGFTLLFLSAFITSSLAVCGLCNARTGKASAEELWASPGWLRLLHYPSTEQSSAGRVSRVDGGRFFLSVHGATDPAAEGVELLDAVQKVKGTAIDEESDPRCRFPARYLFLQKNLPLDESFDPAVECRRLQKWLQGMSPSGLSLVFPVSYLNNPASMFGHTLLRIDSAEFSPDTPLLAASVGYSAVTLEEKGIEYAVKGLLGGYTGKYSAEPYYVHARRYGELENRDIWEYRLDLDREKTTFLLLHVWELREAEFDYFFIDENCSYQILALMEAVLPDSHLTDSYPVWTLPVDTVRDITGTFAGDHQVVYRPSLRTRLEHQANTGVNTELARIAKGLVTGRYDLDDDQYRIMSDRDKAVTLDMALLYHQYLVADNHDPSGLSEDLAGCLLRERSTIPVGKEAYGIPVPSSSPDQAHQSGRIDIGMGVSEYGGFLNFGYRSLLHDLFDQPKGYVKGVEFELFYPVFHYYPEKDSLTLDSFTLLNITSVTPGGTFINPLSWKGSIGVRHSLFTDDTYGTAGYAQIGFGRSVSLTDSLAAFVLLGVEGIASDQFSSPVNLAPKLFGGIYGAVDEHWSVGVSGNISQLLFASEAVFPLFDVMWTNTYSIDADNAVRFDFNIRREYIETEYELSFRWLKYFRL